MWGLLQCYAKDSLESVASALWTSLPQITLSLRSDFIHRAFLHDRLATELGGLPDNKVSSTITLLLRYVANRFFKLKGNILRCESDSHS